MQAIIEIESLQQDWKPPFAKKRETKSITAEEGDTFETLRDGTPLFTLHTVHGNRILLQYNRMYTLKGYEHPTERKLWLALHEPKKFSSLWDENGITLTITLRDVKVGEGESIPAPLESQAEENKNNQDTEIYRPGAI